MEREKESKKKETNIEEKERQRQRDRERLGEEIRERGIVSLMYIIKNARQTHNFTSWPVKSWNRPKTYSFHYFRKISN